MGLISSILGKNENELNQMESDLIEKEKRINNRESDLNFRENKINHENSLLNSEKNAFEASRKSFEDRWQDLLKKESEIHNKMEELAIKEMEAKNGFAQKQNESFKEVIETQIASLDKRKSDLDEFQKELEIKAKGLNELEGKIASRELEVTEREQRADANFADKAHKLAEEAKIQLERNKAEAERLKKLADELANDRELIEKKKAELVKREENVLKDEQIRDNGYSDERINLDKELAEQRNQALNEIQNLKFNAQKDISNYRESQIQKLNNELLAIREKRMDEIDTEIDEKRLKNKEEIEEVKANIIHERENWEQEKKEQEKLKLENENKQKELEKKEYSLKLEEERLNKLEKSNSSKLLERQQNVDEEVEQKLDEKISDLKFKFESEKAEKEKLLRLLANQKNAITSMEALRSCFGGKEPEEILAELNQKTEVINELREKLANSPTSDTAERLEKITLERNELKKRLDDIQAELNNKQNDFNEIGSLKRKMQELEAENSLNAQKAENFELQAKQFFEELKRLRSSYQNSEEVAERYKAIKSPIIELNNPPSIPNISETEMEQYFVESEKEWLDNIYKQCENFGFLFNKRILKAFHTSLKSAEWSPLTVLAGVSGTGKSELPRLYSHFGGILFEPLSVQPNWDCQESMLGFFNSIDNKFDAQPVLRFLAQSQEQWSDAYKGGLKDAVCLVLLDEMNLAHPELYFAEFLSKLELRRSLKPQDLPYLDVKVGAGFEPFKLKLGRNVLWVGTMNQDETTKSLSDKVLDRSIMIYFPRPTELKRRIKLNLLKDSNRGKLLHNKVWSVWRKNESIFKENEEKKIMPYKEFVETINKEALVHVGRALGHRVWQSIEYYISNYPDVLQAFVKKDSAELEKAMHIAFEDQIVQKVMPKLRGIETNSVSGQSCLDKISSLLAQGVNGNSFNLDQDFKLACELGYGQFMWQSANYLNEQEHESIVNNEAKLNKPIDLNKVPDFFETDKSEDERLRYWELLDDSQKMYEYNRKNIKL